MSENIARLVLTARRKLKMKQSDLAAALGVSQGSVSKWEAGRETPRAETLENLKELANLSDTEQERLALHSAKRYAVIAVPLLGEFSDDISITPTNAEEIENIRVPMPQPIPAARTEAWQVSGMYKDLPSSFIGIFQMLEASESLVDERQYLKRRDHVLFQRISPSETINYSIGSLRSDGFHSPEYPARLFFWPEDISTQGRWRPVEVNYDGKSPNFAAQVIGFLIAVLYSPSLRRSSKF